MRILCWGYEEEEVSVLSKNPNSNSKNYDVLVRDCTLFVSESCTHQPDYINTYGYNIVL